MRAFNDLYFQKDHIPEVLQKDLENCSFISEDGESCMRYLLILASTCQVNSSPCQVLSPPVLQSVLQCTLMRTLMLNMHCSGHQEHNGPQLERSVGALPLLHVAQSAGLVAGGHAGEQVVEGGRQHTVLQV